ncbi:M13 family metallopeptidase [Fidelibacter multiformis]|uniref:M13 family metallopeptidase n=1 Tax=Fidelibacter multiformis TaxID=3377529 RepID=UPI0037DDDAAE
MNRTVLRFGMIVITGLLLILSMACTPREILDEPETVHMYPAFDTSNMDLSIKPGEDFYLYVNGKWLRNNPVPDDKVSIGAFREVYDRNQEMIKNLLDEAAKDVDSDPASLRGQVGAYYASGLDSALIEEKGLTPLQARLEMVNTETPDKIIETLAWFHSHFMAPAFDISFYEDPKNTELVIVHLGQSGLGLPEREYYIGQSERLKEIRKEYQDFLSRFLQAGGYTPEKAETAAASILSFETRLAEASMNLVDRRDPQKTYHKMSLSELKALTPDLNWDLYFKTLGLDYDQYYNVHQPDFFREINQMLSNIPPEVWNDYFTWNLMDRMAHYLPSEINALHFDFFNRYLSGQKVMEPRTKRVLDQANWILGDMLARLYVETYFPPEAKEKMTELTGNLKRALKQRIENVDWMTDKTREKALVKLETMRIKIGYPDSWDDFSGLILTRDDYFGNFLRIAAYQFDLEKSKAGQEPDPEEWHMPAHIVNAYYSPLGNEVVFPAGILQPPFFNLHADDPVNYGGIGVVIGHEMTHGFDDHGRQYDENGMLNDWWTAEDAAQFDARSKKLIGQYDRYVVIDTFHINGELTLGENIADLGGVNVAYDALQLAKQNRDMKNIDGFTPDQRFFLGFAQIWRRNMSRETMIRRIMEDEHSPAHYRVVGPLENVDAFYKAFHIQPGDPRYRSPEERVVIW